MGVGSGTWRHVCGAEKVSGIDWGGMPKSRRYYPARNATVCEEAPDVLDDVGNHRGDANQLTPEQKLSQSKRTETGEERD